MSDSDPAVSNEPFDASPAAEGASSAETTDASSAAELGRNIVEWIAVLVFAVVIALVVRAFLLQSYWIKSGSMEETLQIQDRVIVNRLSYQWGEPGRGDIVVFRRPDDISVAEEDLIKRVIAVDGDTVEGRDGQVFVNGEAITENYLTESTFTSDFGPVSLGPDEVWVMGDNRTNSRDSRFFGAIEERDVIGRAFVRYWPLGRAGTP